MHRETSKTLYIKETRYIAGIDPFLRESKENEAVAMLDEQTRDTIIEVHPRLAAVTSHST